MHVLPIQDHVSLSAISLQLVVLSTQRVDDQQGLPEGRPLRAEAADEEGRREGDHGAEVRRAVGAGAVSAVPEGPVDDGLLPIYVSQGQVRPSGLFLQHPQHHPPGLPRAGDGPREQAADVGRGGGPSGATDPDLRILVGAAGFHAVSIM